jgi:Cysteine rich repeat
MPQGTPEERAACARDVHKFCESALQDTMRVLACLQANRPKISAACNRVLVSHGQ